jgi:hypothetical protein
VSPAFAGCRVRADRYYRRLASTSGPAPGKKTKQFAGATKPFPWVDEDVLKPGSASMTFDQTMAY